MKEQSLLEQLKDIHYPESISWWPLAPGWYVLGAILILFVFFICFWSVRLYRKLKKRKKLLKLFEELKERAKKESHSAQIWAELSAFLKRFTLLLYPRQDVSSLHGKAWLQFLNAKGHTEDFTGEIGCLLISIPYQTTPSEKAEALLELIDRWIKQQIKEKL